MTNISEQTEQYFFTASTTKLVLMSICTFGVYELYWFYKNWELLVPRTKKKIRPFWRATFAPFWCFSMFKIFKNTAEEYDIANDFNPTMVGVAYLGLIFTQRLPAPFWFITFLSIIPLVMANTMADKINREISIKHIENDQFSKWNWITLILGSILFVLSIIGTVLP